MNDEFIELRLCNDGSFAAAVLCELQLRAPPLPSTAKETLRAGADSEPMQQLRMVPQRQDRMDSLESVRVSSSYIQ